MRELPILFSAPMVRAITDTKGTRGEKQQASGHKSEQMLDVYDFEVPVVSTSENP